MIMKRKKQGFFFSPFIIPYIFYLVVDTLNDFKINKLYNNIDYNWNQSPIKSIELSSEPVYEIGKITSKKKEYKFYKWRNSFFKIERISNLNYYYIYSKENGKLCGKDSSGNDLFFPEDVEFPINDIIITIQKKQN